MAEGHIWLLLEHGVRWLASILKTIVEEEPMDRTKERAEEKEEKELIVWCVDKVG